MIGWLIARGIPAPLLAVGAAAAAVVGFLLWLHFHDNGVIADETARVNARALETAAAANEGAAREARRDDARNAAEAAQLEKVISDAPNDRPLSDARRAYLRCVRLQQSARAAGSPVPAC